MAEDGDPEAVLSDVDDDSSPTLLSAAPHTPGGQSDPESSRVRDLVAELERERQARKTAEGSLSDLQNSFNRLKVLAHEAIRKRDEALREKDEFSRSADRAASELAETTRLKEEAAKQREEAIRQREEVLKQRDEAIRQKEEALRQRESSRSEIETAAQMLVTGIDKISGKVRNFKNFSAGGLPRSDKYTGLPAVAYGVIKRTNQIVEELMAQVEAAGKSRDQAREQVEQRNFEIAIEVSELEATINGLRDDVSKNKSELERLEKSLAEKETKILDMERELEEARRFGEEGNEKARALQTKLDSQRKLVIDNLHNISKVHEQICEIVRNVDLSRSEQSDFTESLFTWEEMDMDENLKTSLEGTASLYELAKVAAETVKQRTDERIHEVERLEQTVNRMLAEKQHIGTLLKSALSSQTSDVRKVAEDGLREVGIDFKFNGNGHDGNKPAGEIHDEVYTLAGALENTVKASQVEIVELQHLVEALRAESSLLKSHLDAKTKEINELVYHIKELEDKERSANENVEGLMIDVAAAEEEIARWKAAAEEEAAAGRAVEQEFLAKLSALSQELEEAKQAMTDSENKLKFKEETAAAAIAARDAAEKSLRLADVRSTRLRERLEELTRKLEEADTHTESTSQNRPRYMCWPWQWLGLNYVGYEPVVEQTSNEMELSEPLI